MHQVGNQPRLYYDARSANHQDPVSCSCPPVNWADYTLCAHPSPPPQLVVSQTNWPVRTLRRCFRCGPRHYHVSIQYKCCTIAFKQAVQSSSRTFRSDRRPTWAHVPERSLSGPTIRSTLFGAFMQRRIRKQHRCHLYCDRGLTSRKSYIVQHLQLYIKQKMTTMWPDRSASTTLVKANLKKAIG